jgi:hypothetical protein
MPFLVKVAEGDDPRELAENLSDNDAKELAVAVSSETGEEVTLVPYVYDAKAQGYVLDLAGTITVQATAAAEDAVEAGDEKQLDEMSGAELDAKAAELEIADWKKKAKVADKRELVQAALDAQS